MSQYSLIEGLEDRKLMAATPTVTGVKIAKAQASDGTALNSNRITIAFSSAVRLVDASKFESFGYANDLTNFGGQVKKRVTLTVTKYTEGGKVFDNILQIITDRLVRKGSRLTIAAGGLTDTKGNALVYDASTAAKTITFTVGQNKPRYSLSNRAWKPSDPAYFDPAVFTASPPPATAGSTPNAATIRGNLVTFLTKKMASNAVFKITQAQMDSALATYDSSTVAAIIPNANLRAALASLVGTAAEPAIASYTTKANITGKPYTVVDFGSTASSAPVGETKLSVGGRLSTTINTTFAGEPFEVLSSILAHESIHQDNVLGSGGETATSQDEEIVANSVESIVYGQQLLADSSVAGNGTKLVVRSNTRLLALLNSGDTLFPYGGILPAPLLASPGNVFVGAKANPGGFGATPVPSFENWIRREFIFRGFSAGGTNNSPVGQAILHNIVGSKANVTKLGTDTEKALDNSNVLLTDANTVKLAIALKLAYA